jgi:hypothetical protein
MFSPNVCAQLKYYVYRLIDPRNGETFYVGKGKDNRVFMHVRDELGKGADVLNEKLQRIREIRIEGFEVAHVIHRHGMDEGTAFEVEAALIDAYPEGRNLVSGKDSDERGLMHSKQIIERYEAPEAVFKHKAILININQTATERGSVYDAVRYAWKIDPIKAKKAEVVLAVVQGLIVGAFIADEWLSADVKKNFMDTGLKGTGRWGFVGRPAPDGIANLYLRHRIPQEMRKQGAANPIRYTFR